MSNTEEIHLGKTRPSQRSNPLLVRPELGKIRRPTVNLPGDDFVFGRPAVMDAEGAGAVISRWKEHEPAPIREKAGRDFVALNRVGLKAGAVNTQQQQSFRRNNDIRLKIAQSRSSQSKKLPIPSDQDAAFTYGRKTEPSIPLSNIISNVYQEEWLQTMAKKQHEAQPSDTSDNKAQTNRNVRHTKASLGHQSKPQKLESNFKLSRFNNVPGKVVTRRHATETA